VVIVAAPRQARNPIANRDLRWLYKGTTTPLIGARGGRNAPRARFDEMMPSPIAGSVEILADLQQRSVPLYRLTNFSAETYPPTVARFEFLRWLRGVVVSGEVGMVKPDPRIYEIAIERFAIDPHRAVYIDDVPVNAEATVRFGIHGIHFTSAA
jgi:2-haloacid dehalogenase